jgi:hypothetical protein
MRAKIAALRGSAGGGLLGTAGAAAVELALVTPFLLTLIFGGLDFGNLFNTSQSIAAATRAGAQYARNSATCQSGILVAHSPPIATGAGPCTDGIQKATQNAGNFAPALTFPTAPVLACYCDGGATPNTPCTTNPVPSTGLDYSCSTNGRGNNELYVQVSARQAITPLLPWPGFPKTLNGLTELRIY